MKKIILSTAILLSTNLFAEPFDVYGNNPDLYDGYADSKVFPTAVQPGIGDNYGSAFLYSTGFTKTSHISSRGSNEAYGSVLLDVGHPIDW